MKYLFLLTIAFLLFIGCQTKTGQPGSSQALGVLHHPFIVSEAAKEPFERGLLLLHSFEYDDAHEAFSEAIIADSSTLMAYWGKAMTRYKALWGLQDVEAGRAIMNQLSATVEGRLALARDELERDFWIGLKWLFGEGELKERNLHFSKHMENLYHKYPGNEEVAAFYSISLLWSSEMGFDKDKALRAAKIADGILSENPNHPGALHYKIHAYDHPNFALEARQAADLYSKVAPDATHALHMPSHIYLALGLWDEVVSSNEASYSASVTRINRKKLGDGARGFHSYAWLHYGYLQQGRYEDAAQLIKDLYGYVEEEPTASARSYLIMMQNAQLAEAPKWDSTMLPKFEIETGDLGIISEAAHTFFQSHWAFKERNQEVIKTNIDYLTEKINRASLLLSDEGLPMCSAGATRYAPTRKAIFLAKALQHQMESFVAHIQGDETQFEQALITAIENEAETELIGPPEIALPSYEQYGYWLLEKNRAEEAIHQFDQSLKRAPKRVNALRGKINALNKIGKDEEALILASELENIWKKADQEALDFLASS